MTDSMSRNRPYKTQTPYSTIQKIRGILEKLDIFVVEQHHIHSKSGTCSCRIFMGDDELIRENFGTNGKGMNARFSLASAYGEFMERLENSMMIPVVYSETAYRHGELSYACAPDERLMTVSEIIDESGRFLPNIMGLSYEETCDIIKAMFQDTKTPCIPFTEVLSGKQVYIPYRIVTKVNGSNGMCAGNCREEALVQGLSEVMERYSLRLLYENPTAPPLLNPKLFDGTRIFQKLESLKTNGIEYQILDMSMGKSLPVVGLRVIIEGTNVMAMHIGADPNPETALERCLTELFQGMASGIQDRFTNMDCGMPEDYNSLDEYLDNYYKKIGNGSGLYPSPVMQRGTVLSEKFNYSKGATEAEDYKYLLDLMTGFSDYVFIREASYLGFPAYWTIVPSISGILTEGRKNAMYNWHDAYEIELKNAYESKIYKPLLRIFNNIEKVSI